MSFDDNNLSWKDNMTKFDILRQSMLDDYKMQADNLYQASLQPKQMNFQSIEEEYERLTKEIKPVVEIFELLK